VGGTLVHQARKHQNGEKTGGNVPFGYYVQPYLVHVYDASFTTVKWHPCPRAASMAETAEATFHRYA
jgi:hypothetical protein